MVLKSVCFEGWDIRFLMDSPYTKKRKNVYLRLNC